MTRGRRPLPSHLRVLNGNAGRRPINTDEPMPRALLADEAPAWLTERQKEIYVVAKKSAPAGMLGDLDESIFINWVVAYDLFQLFNDDIGKYGRWVKKGKDGTQANPAIPQRNKQAKLLQQFAAELGFTPSARSRVKLDPNAKAKNPFDNLKTFGAED